MGLNNLKACGIIVSMRILNERYENDLFCLYIFMKIFVSEFAGIVTYVDVINSIKTPKNICNLIEQRLWDEILRQEKYLFEIT